eukprot:1913254-Pyramimonas_sp.AAC.1
MSGTMRAGGEGENLLPPTMCSDRGPRLDHAEDHVDGGGTGISAPPDHVFGPEPPTGPFPPPCASGNLRNF